MMTNSGMVTATVLGYETLEFERGRWVLGFAGRPVPLRCLDEDVSDPSYEIFIGRNVPGRIIVECGEHFPVSPAAAPTLDVELSPRKHNEGDLATIIGSFAGVHIIPHDEAYYAIDSVFPIFTDFELSKRLPSFSVGEMVKLTGYLVFRFDSEWLRSEGFLT